MIPTLCPYRKGTQAHRHWAEGFDWYVTGRKRATAPAEFYEGYEAAKTYAEKTGEK